MFHCNTEFSKHFKSEAPFMVTAQIPFIPLPPPLRTRSSSDGFEDGGSHIVYSLLAVVCFFASLYVTCNQSKNRLQTDKTTIEGFSAEKTSTLQKFRRSHHSLSLSRSLSATVWLRESVTGEWGWRRLLWSCCLENAILLPLERRCYS